MKRSLYLVTCLLITISACSTIKKSTKSDVDPKVNNIVWTVVSFHGKTLNDRDFSSGLPAIAFDMQDSKVSGNDGCNSFMGVATYKGDAIYTGAIATTKMACPGNKIQDDFYETLASKHLTWRLDNDQTLRLLVNDAEVMALKERQ